MNALPESNKQWFEEVLQPSIDMLNGFADGTLLSADLDLKAFFQTFLSDLEMVGLDNATVELFVQKILSGLQTLQTESFAPPVSLKTLAEIALSSTFERAFYPEYWKSYRELRKKHPNLNDQDIVNTYHLKSNLSAFLKYLESAKMRELA